MTSHGGRMCLTPGGKHREQFLEKPPEAVNQCLMWMNTAKLYQNNGYRTMEKECCKNVTKYLLYRLYRVMKKEKCSGGKRGVSGVSNVLLVKSINGFNQF